MLNNKDLCAVFFPRDILDEILKLIELVSEGFSTYSYAENQQNILVMKAETIYQGEPFLNIHGFFFVVRN